MPNHALSNLGYPDHEHIAGRDGCCIRCGEPFGSQTFIARPLNLPAVWEAVYQLEKRVTRLENR